MNADSLNFKYLADHEEWVPQVIDWWATVWGDRMGPDLSRDADHLRKSLNKDNFPIHIVATCGGEPVGTAALKLRELPELFPDCHYWLGSVFVIESHRAHGFATALSQRIVEIAREGELPHLYLQTVNLSGGLYRQLGWEAQQQFIYRGEQTLLMKKTL
ncbi:MAG: GNAT family N-acetyltransferase [Gammaproteobacteria bacterium]